MSAEFTSNFGKLNYKDQDLDLAQVMQRSQGYSSSAQYPAHECTRSQAGIYYTQKQQSAAVGKLVIIKVYVS